MIQSITHFKDKCLRWQSGVDGEWFDRDGFSVLNYAVIADRVEIVRQLLLALDQVKETRVRARRLRSSVPKGGLPSLGFTGYVTSLILAMGFGSQDVASLLLEHGADPYESDVAGNELSGDPRTCSIGMTESRTGI